MTAMLFVNFTEEKRAIMCFFCGEKRINTRDDRWIHHLEPESERQSMEWKHPDSPGKKKFKQKTDTLFWDSEQSIVEKVMFYPLKHVSRGHRL